MFDTFLDYDFNVNKIFLYGNINTKMIQQFLTFKVRNAGLHRLDCNIVKQSYSSLKRHVDDVVYFKYNELQTDGNFYSYNSAIKLIIAF